MSERDKYRFNITEQAETDLQKLDKSTAERILRRMIWVAEHASELEHEALKGKWSAAYRWRIGDYRVIYAIDHESKSIVVEVIAHRSSIYK